MQIARSVFLIVGLAGLVLAPLAANAADSTGPTGRVRELEVNSTSSDSYVAYHGKVGIKAGKADPVVVYTWGGTQCQGKTLSDQMVDMLLHAFESRKSTRITPHWKDGAGDHKCLVGFELGSGGDDPVEPAPS